MSTATTAAFLLGAFTGACAVFLLSGLALWFVDVRRAIREGTELDGTEFERNRKRDETR